MNKTPVVPDLAVIPKPFHPFLQDAAIYDSSCSTTARVLFIDKDTGYYLKSAPTLAREAAMTRFYHSRGLAAEVLEYYSNDGDWLLTRAVPGEDCTHFLHDPKRLSETLGEILRRLHESDIADCPVPDRTAAYLATAEDNYRAGKFDGRLYSGLFDTPDDARRFIEPRQQLLQTDTLLHGDFCLPNVMLQDFSFTGLIDVDGGGVGDRHVDLFWGLWSLQYNLKTDVWGNRFLDAYGRDRVDSERLKLVAAIERFG